MTLYTVVHLFDGTLIEGGITLHPFTGRSEALSDMYRQLDETYTEALDDMYRQLDETYWQFNPDEFQCFCSQSLGCAYISHFEATEPHESTKTVYDHEWRIVEM